MFKQVCLIFIMTAFSTLNAKDEHVVAGERMGSFAEAITQMELSYQESGERNRSEDEHLVEKAVYSTSHPGAYHRLSLISAGGSQLTLEDGSVWNLCSIDRYKTQNWVSSDCLIVIPGSHYSSYFYRIVNMTTGTSVDANLYLGPKYKRHGSRWVLNVDYGMNTVLLSDHTLWKVRWRDYSSLKKWLINDTVIIGINPDTLGKDPNVLINVNTLSYIRAGWDR